MQMGPFIHGTGLKLIQILETKTNLANGRPFPILSDYWHTALDVMVLYAFGRNINDKALDPHIDVLSRLDSSSLPKSTIDQAVDFPEASLSNFLEAVQEAP